MYVKGVGMTKFGAQTDTSQELVYEATMEALEDSNTKIDEIDAIVSSIVDSESNGEKQRGFSSIISSIFKRKVPIVTCSAVCGGGGAALWTANKLDYNNILIVGVERLLTNNSAVTTNEILMAAERIYEQAEGMIFPAQNALVAQQYMLKYGATSDDFALVAYKNHQNAFLNPKARFYRKKITMEEIKNSTVVASPLRLFDCSISCNGASSLILSKEPSDIEIIGSAEISDCLSPFEREEMTSLEATKKAAELAYKEADVTPSQIDIAEIHDAFTPLEIISYEDLGFCSPGEGKELIRNGTTKIDGKLPVNTSGGLKAKGHPISPTGIAQVYEIVKQMRGQAGARQIKTPRIGLAHNLGGAGSVATVHILKNLN